jgi:hypothetical protein
VHSVPPRGSLSITTYNILSSNTILAHALELYYSRYWALPETRRRQLSMTLMIGRKVRGTSIKAVFILYYVALVERAGVGT